MIRYTNGDVLLSDTENNELAKAYMDLYELIRQFPTSLSEFFPKEDFLNIVKWHAQVQGHEFVEEYWT